MEKTNNDDWMSQIKHLDEDQIHDTTSGFRQNYLSNTTRLEKFNLDEFKIFEYPDKQKYIRIATWNIRYFTDINDNMSIDKIQTVVSLINADILCLNEVTLGFNKYYGAEVSLTEKFPEYHVISFCNTIPSWFSTAYGNCILIKKTLYDKACTSDVASQVGIVNSYNKCFFNQYARTYNHPKPYNVELDNTDMSHFGPQETRCFIKISFIDFDIYCTHLEAYDKHTRLKQFDELMTNVTRKSIILGDLNIINTSSYLNKHSVEWNVLQRVNSLSENNSEIDMLKQRYGLKDSFEMSKSNKNFYGYTTWTNTIVDYILFTSEWLSDDEKLPITNINSNIYITDASDHYPIYVDIESNNFSLIMTPDSKKFSDVIGTHSTFEKMNFDHESAFYHVSPLGAFDWFDGTKITQRYSFNDPYLTGNFSMMYGTNGVYIGMDPGRATNFLETLVSRTAQKSENSLLNYVGILFEFKIKQTYDINTDDNDAYKIAYGETYNKINDDNYNLIYSLASGIGKLTKRNYDEANKIHRVFELSKKYLVYKLNLPDTHDFTDDQIKKYIRLEKIFNMALKYIEDLHKSRSATDGYTYNLSENGYKNTFNIGKIKIIRGYSDIDILFPLWEQFTGGYNNNYYYKYTKYKSKYMNIKNNKAQ